MPSRIIPFINGQFYHVYNRGVEKRRIFENSNDLKRFTKTIQYYQYKGPKPRFSIYSPKISTLNTRTHIVEIISFCLMPNHFHLLLKQTENGGITEFLSKISNSYTKYFNNKNHRVGPLLQSEFKAVLIETDEQLLHLSRYIHLNPVVSYLVKDLSLYPWSSYKEFINYSSNGFCKKEEVLNFFKSPLKYKQFVLDHSNYAQQLEKIKHQLIEEN